MTELWGVAWGWKARIAACVPGRGCMAESSSRRRPSMMSWVPPPKTAPRRLRNATSACEGSSGDERCLSPGLSRVWRASSTCRSWQARTGTSTTRSAPTPNTSPCSWPTLRPMRVSPIEEICGHGGSRWGEAARAKLQQRHPADQPEPCRVDHSTGPPLVAPNSPCAGGTAAPTWPPAIHPHTSPTESAYTGPAN